MAEPGYRRYEGVDPELLTPEYHSTLLRAPERPLTVVPQTLSELTGPAFGHAPFGDLDHDLTRQHPGDPLGERIILGGRVLDGDGRPVPSTLIEIWQANAAGRYVHAPTATPRRWTPTSAAPGAASPTPTGATSSSRSGRAPIRWATRTTSGGPPTSTSRSSAPPSPPGW